MAEKFIEAAKDGYVDLLREAQRKELNTPDEDGRTATHWAAHNGNLEALRLIVGRGGDVNKSDFLGNTCLHLAAAKGHMDVVSYLVNWGCNLYALDNDEHSALDIAGLNNRVDIIKFLDNARIQQQQKNPKLVMKLREDAQRVCERNRKRYERLQEEAARRAAKEDKRIRAADPDFRPPGKMSFIKTLTLKIKGNPANSKPRVNHFHTSRKYSEMAGFATSGAGRKIYQKKILTDDSAFNIGSGLRSLNGVPGTSADVIYNRTVSDATMSGGNPSRTIFDVFPNGTRTNLVKAKSESDILFDSGVDSYHSDNDDDEKGGVFYRPGFGQTAFLRKNPFVNTLHSFEQDNTETNDLTNGFSGDANSDDGIDRSFGFGVNGVSDKMKELPWDPDEVENLDDDDDDSEFTALEMFLVSSGLSTYIPYFTKEKVNLELLMKLTDSEFKEIGIPFGPRKKLAEVIAKRRDILNTPTAMADTFL
ncbi:Usher syndrome type-1G protein homolog [Gigantopelta aegis]|uniref:Usher syndrome type-1G protein homolog n=1 Tax=Gigantopelta aegis TaxID=1735272 RepID=UPI001B889B70|nr:Usher syndrome type-1G protein homolog [Gigantopelta aegis]